MQHRPFEEWIEKGYQRDANLCGACARPIGEHSLVTKVQESTTKALLCTLQRGVGVRVSAGVTLVMEWFEWMWRVALSLATVGTRHSIGLKNNCFGDSPICAIQHQWRLWKSITSFWNEVHVCMYRLMSRS